MSDLRIMLSFINPGWPQIRFAASRRAPVANGHDGVVNLTRCRENQAPTRRGENQAATRCRENQPPQTVISDRFASNIWKMP